MQMLSQLMGLAQGAQQIDSESQVSPLKAQYLQEQIRGQQFDNTHAQEQMDAQNQYHKMMSLPQAVMGIQSAGYGPEEMKLMLQKMFGIGEYDVPQAGRDYVKRMMPKESAIFEQLKGH